MQDWMYGFQESIDYIERNLTEPIRVESIAEKAALSPFYYQRIFAALCGMTVGEYIRARRMTLAAQELSGRTASKAMRNARRLLGRTGKGFRLLDC